MVELFVKYRLIDLVEGGRTKKSIWPEKLQFKCGSAGEGGRRNKKHLARKVVTYIQCVVVRGREREGTKSIGPEKL